MTHPTFRDLHRGPDLLLLANAWDAGSARVIEDLGARAIATTSAGLAWSRGYPDGDALPLPRLLDAVREIARVIRVPLSVDVEGGYSDDPAQVAEVVSAMIEAGAVGINLEDGAASPELTCRKIEAVREAAQRAGTDLFVNLRTDVYLRKLAGDGRAVEEVVRRAALYRDAGADGLFVPGLSDAGEIAAVLASIALPLNLMMVPTLPPIDELQAFGVRRLSAGSAISQAAMGTLSRLAGGFLRGDMAGMFEGAAEYSRINALFPSS